VWQQRWALYISISCRRLKNREKARRMRERRFEEMSHLKVKVGPTDAG
jgi:hypothetical protein